jgi:hypothetical protein
MDMVTEEVSGLGILSNVTSYIHAPSLGKLQSLKKERVWSLQEKRKERVADDNRVQL